MSRLPLPTHQCPPPQPCTSLRSQVVSDDCTPVYWQQPGCTQVIEGMQRLGYRPVSDTPCTPPHPRLRPSHYCELEVLFVQPGLPAASHEPYLAFHSIHAKCAASAPHRIPIPDPRPISAPSHQPSRAQWLLTDEHLHGPHRARGDAPELRPLRVRPSGGHHGLPHAARRDPPSVAAWVCLAQVGWPERTRPWGRGLHVPTSMLCGRQCVRRDGGRAHIQTRALPLALGI